VSAGLPGETERNRIEDAGRATVSGEPWTRVLGELLVGVLFLPWILPYRACACLRSRIQARWPNSERAQSAGYLVELLTFFVLSVAVVLAAFTFAVYKVRDRALQQAQQTSSPSSESQPTSPP
jgi:hypothetical protein